ncbi:MAG: DUF2007 domain-containing protein [Verrucomicrobiota bacterium]
MQLVTVYQTFSPADAQLVRSRLEAADFQAIIAHELSALSMEGYSMTTGGILVQVPDEQAEEARLLIQTRDSSAT